MSITPKWKRLSFYKLKRNPQKYWTLLFGNDEIDIDENDKVGAEIRKIKIF